VHCRQGLVPDWVGAAVTDHLAQNLAATQVELSPLDLQETDARLSAIKVHGGRMHPKFMVEVEE